MLLRGVEFPTPALTQSDIQVTKGRAATTGRNHGGVPLKGDGRGRNQFNYAGGPNQYSTPPNYQQPRRSNGHNNNGYQAPPPPGWQPPPPGMGNFARGLPPPPPGYGGYPPGPPPSYYGAQPQPGYPPGSSSHDRRPRGGGDGHQNQYRGQR